MKIVLFTFSLTSGGAEKFVVDLANELSKSHEVYCCVILSKKLKQHSFFKSHLNNNVTYLNFNSFRGINIKSFFFIFKLLLKIKPDVVHFHLNTILFMYLPAILFKNKISFIHTLHNLAPMTIGFKWQKWVNKYFYARGLIKPVAISGECKESFIDFYGIKEIKLIENGVSKSQATTLFEKVKIEVDGYKGHPSNKVFIHIGRFSEQKNQKLLIRVFNRLIKEGKPIKLIVIGKGFDLKKAEELKENAIKGIYFLGTRNNVSDYLHYCDAFVLTSLWEGMPISLLESMSCGAIPVCTPAGGIIDVIKDDTIGFLSEDFTENGFYEAVLNCINEMSNFDREHIQDYYQLNYSMEKCAEEYYNFYIN